MAVPAYRSPTWHWMQLVVRCTPVRVKPVVAWSNVAPAQLVVVWHVAQAVRPSLPADAILANAPDRRADFYRVPRFVGDGETS